MIRRQGARRRAPAWLAAVLVTAAATPAVADDRYLLIVSGASGGPPHAERQAAWHSSIVAALRAQPGFREDHLVQLAETGGPGVGVATRAGVRDAVGGLAARMDPASVLSVVLIGHGTDDGEDAKFNLVGPDLTASEWDALLAAVPGRIALVDTTASSYPFLTTLARAGRVVVTATSAAAQRYDTVFPEFFAAAFADAASDLDRDGRLSVWEAFVYASAAVGRWYQREGRLATEHARLDETGDGRGVDAETRGPGVGLASMIHLAAGVDVVSPVADRALVPLIARRAALEAEVDALRASRTDHTPAAYAVELERLLVALAEVSRAIREQTGAAAPR